MVVGASLILANAVVAVWGFLSYRRNAPPGPWFTPFAGASDDRVRSVAEGLGLTTVGWSVESGDWDPAATSDSVCVSFPCPVNVCTRPNPRHCP